MIAAATAGTVDGWDGSGLEVGTPCFFEVGAAIPLDLVTVVQSQRARADPERRHDSGQSLGVEGCVTGKPRQIVAGFNPSDAISSLSMEAHKELVARFLHALVRDDSQTMRPLVRDDVIWWVPSSASRKFGLDRPLQGWDDIDWRNNRIVTFRHKTESGFAIPLFHQLRPLLERRFANRHGREEVFSVKKAAKAIAGACKRLNLPNYTHICFRRMFITRALERGVDVKTLAEWQGHKDGGKLILGTYSHVRADHSERMAQLMTDSEPENVVPMPKAMHPMAPTCGVCESDPTFTCPGSA